MIACLIADLSQRHVFTERYPENKSIVAAAMGW